ncbi:MAG TPA: amidophosphoribosyltransferase [Clostridiales bacterium]|nr:amidophosphoribosyltransferase [Clostridiales bacterium]
MIYDINDKIREECGVFGILDNDGHNVAQLTYYGLFALQHRGQESTGIAVNDSGTIIYYKDIGLVPEVFNSTILDHLKGQAAIGHVLYSPDSSNRENVQPIVLKYKSGQMAISYNGNLLNASKLRQDMEERGAIFQTNSDAELIASLISRYRIISDNIEEALIKVMKDIKGSYAFVIMTPKKLIAIRDPLGMKPLCIGKLDNSYVVASESSAVDAVGGKLIRNVNPGEIVVIQEDGIKSIQTEVTGKTKLCIFEFVYFARQDSYIDGASVYRARLEAGRRLAIEHPVDADLVIGVPDSGLIAALGYSRESSIPYGSGLIKNRYVGRTFIKPGQSQREEAVRIKLNVIRNEIEGKRIVMVDDSIVRGTTTKAIVHMLKEGGAREVHIRISSAPYKFPCHFGIDTPSAKHLVASNYSLEEIRKMVGADSLKYLSLDGLLKTPIGSDCDFCCGCFTGDYPLKVE